MNVIENGRKVLKVEKYSKLLGDEVVTSVKLSEQGKRLLDTLQAEVTLKSGKKVSQQELLELALAAAKKQKDELVSKISKGPRFPLGEKEIKKILSSSRDCGVVTSEEDIDKYLYGRG